MRPLLFAAALSLVALPAFAQDAGGAKSLDQLLQEVRAGRQADAATNRQREAEFQQKKDQQAGLLARTRAERQRLEQESAALEKEFQANERELAALEDQLTERLGSLGELFGVVRQVAGDTRALVESSMTSAEHEGRAPALAKLAESKSLPDMDELVNLWFALQQEATEAGKVSRFQAPVVGTDGNPVERTVTRVGPFTAIADGEFLTWNSETQSLQELGRQPSGPARRAAASFEGASGARAVAPLDPSKGSILALEVQRPSAGEQVQQGGVIGYIILGLGAAGALLAAWRFFVLFGLGRRIKAQQGRGGAGDDNPLGRILAVYEANPGADTETLDLKLDEAVLREVPPIERGITTVRVLSVIAPLLGLLGTVTGMIQTFQMITLYGTGDPKMMAGGISVALVTTMLGLIVAIPLTFLASVLKDRSKGLIGVLEEQAAGMVARRAEEQGGAAS